MKHIVVSGQSTADCHEIVRTIDERAHIHKSACADGQSEAAGDGICAVGAIGPAGDAAAIGGAQGTIECAAAPKHLTGAHADGAERGKVQSPAESENDV